MSAIRMGSKRVSPEPAGPQGGLAPSNVAHKDKEHVLDPSKLLQVFQGSHSSSWRGEPVAQKEPTQQQQPQQQQPLRLSDVLEEYRAVKGVWLIIGSILFAALAFAALALSYPDPTMIGDFRTQLVAQSLTLDDAQGHPQAFADQVTLMDATNYMLQHALKLLQDSDSRFPSTDGVVYVGEGMLVKHIVLWGITSQLDECKSPAALAATGNPKACLPVPSLEEKAQMLSNQSSLIDFRAAEQHTLGSMGKWLGPMVWTKIWSEETPRADGIAHVQALMASQVPAMLSTQFSEVDMVYVTTDAYQPRSFVLYRLQSFLADTIPGRNPTLQPNSHAVDKTVSVSSLPTQLTPLALVLCISLLVWCASSIVLEVYEMRLHWVLHGTLWRYVGSSNLVEWVCIGLVIYSVLMRLITTGMNKTALDAVITVGWHGVVAVENTHFHELYVNGLFEFLYFYVWLVASIFLAMLVFRHFGVHKGIGVFTELLAIAGTPLKNIGLVILYIIVMCAAFLYFFFSFAGANVDYDSFGESLLHVLLLALGYYDYNQFSQGNIAFAQWVPIVAFVFLVMVGILVIISQSIILAIIGVAYDKATEEMSLAKPISSFGWFTLKVAALNLMYYWYRLRFMFSGGLKRVVEQFLATEWVTSSRDGRAFILTLLPEAHLLFTYYCEPRSLDVLNVSLLQAREIKARIEASAAGPKGQPAGATQAWADGSEHSSSSQTPSAKPRTTAQLGEDEHSGSQGAAEVKAVVAAGDVAGAGTGDLGAQLRAELVQTDEPLDYKLLTRAIALVDRCEALQHLKVGPFGLVWGVWRVQGGESAQRLYNMISTLYLDPKSHAQKAQRAESAAAVADGSGTAAAASVGGFIFGRERRRREALLVAEVQSLKVQGEELRAQVDKLQELVQEQSAAMMAAIQQLGAGMGVSGGAAARPLQSGSNHGNGAALGGL